MPGGTVIDRNWLVLLDDGTPAVDWGDGTMQNIITGEFIADTGRSAAFPVPPEELARMAKAGVIIFAGEKQVELHPLPERKTNVLG